MRQVAAFRLLATVVGLAVFFGAAREANGIPRYSARYEQNCILCHFNPTGGGQRSTYASQYLVPMEMVLDAYRFEELERIKPEVSENVVIGTDIRTIARYSDDELIRRENNFFQMQGDLYLSLQADEKFAAYLDRGMSQTYEVFGIAYVLPFNGYVKTGRFTPAYGWKFADHSAFVRERLGFLPPAHSDVGVETGFYPGRSAIHLSILNGAQGSPLDNNDALSFVARAAYRFNLSGFGLSLGGSYRRSDDRPSVSDPRERRNTGGPFGYLKWRRVTWLGEVDWTEAELPESDEEVTSFVTSHEVAVQVIRGVDLFGAYSFFDPDKNEKTGAWKRLALGLDLFLNPFTKISAIVQSYKSDRGTAISLNEYTQSVIQAHFLY